MSGCSRSDLKSGGRSWIRTSEGVSQQIYSLPPLATWVSYQQIYFETLTTKPSPPHWVVVSRILNPENNSARQAVTGQVQRKTSGKQQIPSLIGREMTFLPKGPESASNSRQRDIFRKGQGRGQDYSAESLDRPSGRPPNFGWSISSRNNRKPLRHPISIPPSPRPLMRSANRSDRTPA